jgi:hypothetical protein
MSTLPCKWAQMVRINGTMLQARWPYLQQVLPSAACYIKHALHPKDVRPIWLPVPQQRLCPLAHPAAVQCRIMAHSSSCVSYQSLGDAHRTEALIIGDCVIALYRQQMAHLWRSRGPASRRLTDVTWSACRCWWSC